MEVPHNSPAQNREDKEVITNLPGFLVDAHSQLSLALRLSKLPPIANMGRGIKLREDSHTPKRDCY